jgi:hypothetical protein
MMDKIFWKDVYNTAKYWLLGVLVIGLGVGFAVYPRWLGDFWAYCCMLAPAFAGVLLYLFFPGIFFGVATSMAIYLWNPSKKTFTWSKIFSLILWYQIFFSLCLTLKNSVF